MKSALFTTLVFITIAIQTVFSQQWIDQKYTYDSVLNVQYGTSIDFLGNPETHAMDIYLPDCDDSLHLSRRPLAIFIHGGAFIAGSKDEINIQNLCKRFASQGYVTASIDYRLGFVSDDAAWSCNYPNYNCVFAADTAEWYRAYYRSIQDAKGALRYLINRHDQYRIDTNNVFLGGESAGSFVALGVALMDVGSEKFGPAFALADVPAPNPNTAQCVYNVGKTFPAMIARPDLGGIDGTIEPTTVDFTIKGIGNFYGGMVTDLLQNFDASKPKPAIYSFHQPCDMVVPFNYDRIYAPLSWCMTNGYNCYGIANTPYVYGSQGFSALNANNSYGYTIQNHFTATTFPYSYIGPGGCLDQVNTPCHAYDNYGARVTELTNFFAPLVTTSPICDTAIWTTGLGQLELERDLQLYPNPTNGSFTIRQLTYNTAEYTITDTQGRTMKKGNLTLGDTEIELPISMKSGVYFVTVSHANMQVSKRLNLVR